MRSSILDDGQRLTSFVSVSASKACGFTALSLQVSISEAIIAQLAPPSSLLAKRAFFRSQDADECDPNVFSLIIFGALGAWASAAHAASDDPLQPAVLFLKLVTLDFSRPGKPTDNAFIESFNGKLRAECLNARWFMCLADAVEKCEAWRRYYNEVRPHSAIGKKPPVTLIERSAAQGPRRPEQAGKSSSG